MKEIIEGRPPIYDEIVRLIGRPPPEAVFTWGDVLYVGHPPYGFRHNLTPDLMEHEATHQRQQMLAGGPMAWWEIYLRDRSFRMSQELAAYRAQYACFANSGRAVKREVLRALAQDFSGPMYGKIITYARAVEKIKEA